ncbi:MAG: hypothetical protein H7841_09350 [Magnetospirillum sp. WYHS-4]
MIPKALAFIVATTLAGVALAADRPGIAQVRLPGVATLQRPAAIDSPQARAERLRLRDEVRSFRSQRNNLRVQ